MGELILVRSFTCGRVLNDVSCIDDTGGGNSIASS